MPEGGGLDADPDVTRRANARLRREGTPNLVRAARAAGAWRLVAQSIAWVYAPGMGEGAMVHVALEDCAYYVRWLFDHPERANGMDLEVAIEHVRYADLDAYFAPFPTIAAQPAGYNADPADKGTMSCRENFTGFWNQ